jgi:plastocyanin
MQRFSIRHAPTLVPVLLTFLLAGCNRGPTATVGDRETQTFAATNRETSKALPTQVVIDNFTYAPASLTVAVGTKVTWVNHDDVPHTVTSPSKPRILDSPTLDTDDKFSFEFKTPGTYDYFCTVHPKMTGQIIVK